MIRAGDIVPVRTYETRRKTNALVQYVNYRFGWYTATVTTRSGETYNESYWIRDYEEQERNRKNKTNAKTNVKREWLDEDDPTRWLDEWSEGREQKHGKGF